MPHLTINTTIPPKELPTIFEVLGKHLEPKYYKGEPVVTFADIDFLHERPSGTARRNFYQNRDKLIEQEDFIELKELYEFRTAGFTRPQGGKHASTILITQSGYLMLVKSFKDDLAWKVQRVLVKSYFGYKTLWLQQQLDKIASMQEKGMIAVKPCQQGAFVWTIKLSKGLFIPEQWVATSFISNYSGECVGIRIQKPSNTIKTRYISKRLDELFFSKEDVEQEVNCLNSRYKPVEYED